LFQDEICFEKHFFCKQTFIEISAFCRRDVRGLLNGGEEVERRHPADGAEEGVELGRGPDVFAVVDLQRRVVHCVNHLQQ
jgi:hypothetical protein